MAIPAKEDPQTHRGTWIVVIGASAGGVEALQRLVAELPVDLPAAVFVVLHMAAHSNSVLPAILGRRTAMSTTRAERNLPIRAGEIVVSKPDFHLLVHHGISSVDRGPKVSGVRPSIDVLFRSAAISHGERVIGVILSGTLDDGAAGLMAVRQHGGITAVQSPEDASFKEMPQSAIDLVAPDHVATASQLGVIIRGIVEENAVAAADPPLGSAGVPATEGIGDTGKSLAATPSAFTCPECHGTLWTQPEGEPGFRCRVGHAWTMRALLGGKEAEIEAALWAGMRAVDEQVELVRSMAHQAELRGDAHSVSRLAGRAEALKSQANTLREFLMADLAELVEEEVDT